ncbi:uncharacterized protein EI90DRAFT_2400248 [Cantharellus anzutake]|uniref:uncharacterized protein n=1 Tax=Cantharellus anzutake TaxID=1750568 RepID=UPI00190432C9|nr:uncharacterized protein EI90DRAFT_2400248 [Cantharellus anzutake]KAF8322830.1 hypothetical protein EI90DRAFT_2400248 [Cantharellus anzutake]
MRALTLLRSESIARKRWPVSDYPDLFPTRTGFRHMGVRGPSSRTNKLKRKSEGYDGISWHGSVRTTNPFLAWRFQCILGMSGSVVWSEAEKPRLTRFGKTYPTQFQHNPALSLSASCKRGRFPTCLLDFKPCSPIAEHVSIGGEAGMIAFINIISYYATEPTGENSW